MSSSTDDEAAADAEQVSALLVAAERGEPRDRTAAALFSALYRELHRIAQRELHRGGGAFELTSFDVSGFEPPAATAAPELPLEQLGDALDALAHAEPALAERVDLKHLCGFSLAEIAAMRGVSEPTAQRHWDRARLFLRHAIDSDA